MRPLSPYLSHNQVSILTLSCLCIPVSSSLSLQSIIHPHHLRIIQVQELRPLIVLNLQPLSLSLPFHMNLNYPPKGPQQRIYYCFPLPVNISPLLLNVSHSGPMSPPLPLLNSGTTQDKHSIYIIYIKYISEFKSENRQQTGTYTFSSLMDLILILVLNSLTNSIYFSLI